MYGSRREFLCLLGLTGVAALAAACSSTPPVAPISASAAPTSPPTVQAAAKPTSAPAAMTTGPASQPTQQPPAQAASSASSSAAISEAEWAKVVDAAKQEGKVIVATYAGTGYRKVMDDFEVAFPGIKVDQTGFQSSSSDFFPRFLRERQAGLFAWDVMIVPSTEPLVQGLPQHSISPVRPLIVRADVLDDKSWVDGFDGGWLDTGKQYSYAITRSRSQVLWIDTDQVKDGEVTSYKSLLDPKWKGKIIAGDPRTKGSGYWPTTVLRVKTSSDDIVQQLFKDQETVISTDARQMTEFQVRGRYPVGFGAISPPILHDFLAQGLGKNLKPIPTVEIDYVNSGDHVLHYVDKAPNPNGAKVLVNWLLGKDGSTSYAKYAQDNSRRADVAVFDPSLVPEKGVDYVTIDAEGRIPEILKTQQIAKQVLS